MINLIPPAAHKKIVIEYWVRVITVGLFMVGTALAVSVVTMLPSYFLINVQKQAIVSVVSESSQKVASYDVSASELEIATKYAELLLQVPDALFTDYQKTIEQLAGGNISITSLRFSGGDKKPGTIAIDGMATNRQALSGFRDALDARDEFVRVDLPISNLIKDKDISFSIQVQTATSTAKSKAI